LPAPKKLAIHAQNTIKKLIKSIPAPKPQAAIVFSAHPKTTPIAEPAFCRTQGRPRYPT